MTTFSTCKIWGKRVYYYIMTFKIEKFIAPFALLLSLSVVAPASAQDADAGDKSEGLDPKLKEEIAYVEALVNYGFSSFAEIVIEDTKKKWPESEALFFAIEIRNLLLLGKSEEVDKLIASLPDRKSSKYWAARLEVANDHYNRSRNEQCLKEYEEFFKGNANPPKELTELVRKAHWQRAQILMAMKRYRDAAKDLEAIMVDVAPLKNKDDEAANLWCTAACDAADLYLRVASELPAKDRKADLASAKTIISKLLWERDKPVYFGRAIAMKAHLELLGGRLDRAQGVIDDYMEDLADIHDQLEKADPDGRYGLLKLSPMPQCRYLLADMLWKEALKKSKTEEDLKKNKSELGDLLFGAKGKNGRRNNAGAYNHAVNVYVRFPHSPWASAAEKTVDEIEKFMDEKFGKKIETKITPAQRAKVREMRFRNADEKFGAGEFETAIADYYEALSAYPEEKESINALYKIVDGYYELMKRTTDSKKLDQYRMYADVVSGYLAERFAGNSDDVVMNAAGNAVMSIAAKEKRRNDLVRANALYYAFIDNYTRHINAPILAAQLGGEAYQKAVELGGDLAASKYREALKYLLLMDKYYTNSTFYAGALSSISSCYDGLGDKPNAIAYLKKYINNEKNDLSKMRSQMRLASIYQKDGFALLGEISEKAKSASLSTNATPDEATQTAAKFSEQEVKAVAMIINGIKEFNKFSKEAEAKLNDPSVSKEDKEKFQELHEIALFYAGFCWSRLIEPSKHMPIFAKKNIKPLDNAVACLEAYVSKYPNSERFSKGAYRQLAAIHTTNNNIEKTKDALDRLCKFFPDSDEARIAWPMLAKSLVEFSQSVSDPERKAQLIEESSRLYKEMIDKGDKLNYKPQDYVMAGESLIEAKKWALAEEAFDKAINIASRTNNLMTVMARATIGKIEVNKERGNYVGAISEIEGFLENKRLAAMPIGTNVCVMAVEIAKKHGDVESYKTANKALDRLGKYYWKDSPAWQKDIIKLMSADMHIAQAEVDEKKGDKKAAFSKRGRIASSLYGIVDSRKPLERAPENQEENNSALAAKTSGEKTLDQFSPRELAVLEEAYAKLVPMLMTLEKKQYGDVKKLGEEYLKYFPDGPNAQKIRETMDMAAKEAAL